MSDYKAENSEWFEKNELTPPSTTQHGLDEDIRDKLKPLKVSNWHLEGNELVGQTEMGTLRQTIKPNVIMTGVDDDGMPVFKKVDTN